MLGHEHVHASLCVLCLSVGLRWTGDLSMMHPASHKAQASHHKDKQA